MVLAMWAFVRVFGLEFASMLYHQTFAVGVVGGLLSGAINLAGPIKDCVQLGWAVLVTLEGFFRAPDIGLQNPTFTVLSSAL